MEAITRYPGSVGEIIQGNYNGIDVLLSCPVNLFTKVRVFESNLTKINFPAKSNRMLENLLIKWNLEEYIDKIHVEIRTNIPKSKGFASSTADLCGTYHSMIKLFNRDFNEDELMEECLKIEPTDSIIFNKMTIFDYKNGCLKEEIGDYLKFYLLVFEGKNRVNTIEFNKKASVPLSNIDDMVEDLRIGIRNRDINKIGQVSTESITRNQNRLKYDILWDIISLKDRTGGVGVVGAHSGDLLAILYDDFYKAKRALMKTPSLVGYKKYILKSIDVTF